MSATTLKPVKRQFHGPFISIDFKMLLENLQKILTQQDKHFSEPVDTISWKLIKSDGQRSGEKPVTDLMSIRDLYDENTAQIQLEIFKKKTTSTYGFQLPSEEIIVVRLDFDRKDLFFSATVIGEQNSREIFETATSGIPLIGVALPTEHQYLETYLCRFHQDYPDYERNVFLIMRFQQQPPFADIVKAIRRECEKWNLKVLRADDKEYTNNLWDNVMTYLYGCKSAIAVFDQINYREFNPNIALEVGFLLAQGKRVLLLKDQAIPVMPTDIIGKIYHLFNTYDAPNTIPPQVGKWVTDYKIGE